ncbi:MAG: mercury methylation ferredoxin HgcB [Clostridia bacterium]
MQHKYLKQVASLDYHPEKCVGCGICVQVCPHAVFVLNEGKADLVDLDKCMECGACELNCAFAAIKLKSGVG